MGIHGNCSLGRDPRGQWRLGHPLLVLQTKYLPGLVGVHYTWTLSVTRPLHLYT